MLSAERLMRTNLFGLGAVLGVSVFLGACGGATRDDGSVSTPPVGSATGAPSPTPGPTPGPGPVPVPNSGPPVQSVGIPGDATVTLKSKGGFAANGADVSVCTVVDDTMSLDVAGATLTWKRCELDTATNKNNFVAGTRKLSNSESAELNATLSALRVQSTAGSCGGDKSETLDVTSPRGTETFYDTFSFCENNKLVHVQGLDDVNAGMSALAHD